MGQSLFMHQKQVLIFVFVVVSDVPFLARKTTRQRRCVSLHNLSVIIVIRSNVGTHCCSQLVLWLTVRLHTQVACASGVLHD